MKKLVCALLSLCLCLTACCGLAETIRMKKITSAKLELPDDYIHLTPKLYEKVRTKRETVSFDGVDMTPEFLDDFFSLGLGSWVLGEDLEVYFTPDLTGSVKMTVANRLGAGPTAGAIRKSRNLMLPHYRKLGIEVVTWDAVTLNNQLCELKIMKTKKADLFDCCAYFYAKHGYNFEIYINNLDEDTINAIVDSVST